MNDILDLRAMIEYISAETPFVGEMRYHEPMSAHTAFKVGGPADLWIRPAIACFPAFASALLGNARTLGVPLFILGGGANLVVSDRGIRGIVLDATGWTGWAGGNLGDGTGIVVVRSGTPVDDLVDAVAEKSWGGLEFLAGMPGSVGGAVWMNARCYGRQVSDALVKAETVELADENLRRAWVPCDPGDFSYKRSPFQRQDAAGFRPLILAAEFRLEKRESGDIRRDMEGHRKDREEKGHFRYPSAGSVFKNNREFGKPTGQIIDELGLRGLSVGGAQVAPWHGNIIVNTGNATAADIRELTTQVAEKAKRELGYDLEAEIIFAGDW